MSAAGELLLVEDDASVLRAMASVLRYHGFDVECHEAAPTALDALDGRPFDLVVTDLHLRGATGLELLRRVDERRLETSVILITGEPTVASAIEALRLSAVDYVLKPFDPQDLVERVRRGVEKARARRRVAEARIQTTQVVEMLDALRTVLDVPGGVSPSAPPPSVLRGLTAEQRDALSPREIEVLQRMIEGRSPKQIAADFFLSQHTVRNHVRSIYAKLGVHSQLELLRKVVT